MATVFEGGYLKVILGPMFAGKTTNIINEYNKYTAMEYKCIAINHDIDTRYGENVVSNHNQIKIPSINTSSLCKIKDVIIKYKVLFINEGQFFSELYAFVSEMLELDKIIFVCGLDGDFRREKFGYILDIIPLADEVVKVNGICHNCKRRKSLFTHRMIKEGGQIVVGNQEIYMALCRPCYRSLN
jgi:thymidine kinase